MPVVHKFLNHNNWKNGFWTENAILKTNHYKPEVLFLGTFNHGFEWNTSDFFYGRGMYMWTIMSNLFIHNENHLIQRRSINNNIPSLDQIFEICKKGKIVFADLIKGTKDGIQTIVNQNQKCVIVQKDDNQYCWHDYKDNSILDLMNLGFIDDNVEDIINYINNNQSIKFVYCTFKSGELFLEMIEKIRRSIRPEVSIGHIFTPTGNGFGKNLQIPFNERAWSISHCWVWNNLRNDVFINKEGYSHLNHDWLRRCDVDPLNF